MATAKALGKNRAAFPSAMKDYTQSRFELFYFLDVVLKLVFNCVERVCVCVFLLFLLFLARSHNKPSRHDRQHRLLQPRCSGKPLLRYCRCWYFLCFCIFCNFSVFLIFWEC